MARVETRKGEWRRKEGYKLNKNVNEGIRKRGK